MRACRKRRQHCAFWFLFMELEIQFHNEGSVINVVFYTVAALKFSPLNEWITLDLSIISEGRDNYLVFLLTSCSCNPAVIKGRNVKGEDRHMKVSINFITSLRSNICKSVGML